MPADDELFASVVESALDTLRGSPKNLQQVMEFVASSNDYTGAVDVSTLLKRLGGSGPNDRTRHALTMRLQRWDHEPRAAWAAGTPAHSVERRERTLQLLGIRAASRKAMNAAIPIFSESQIPVVIAESHEPWLEDRKPKLRRFYWNDYARQLAKPKGRWSSEAVASLDASTDDVLARLSDPTRAEIWPVKGLVMG